MATPAPSCKKALTDATLKWPDRDRASDGIMASAAHHKMNPHSDHELGNAFDLTEDPTHGVDCAVLSRELISDPRVTYVIFNREIYRTYKPQLDWVAYHGPSAHTEHLHCSIKPESRDDLSPWPWSPVGTEPPSVSSMPVLRLTNPPTKGEAVKLLQQELNRHGFPVVEDGIFGYGVESAIKKFQLSKGLKSDGIVGDRTWAALK